jgi:hypothetical protein
MFNRLRTGGVEPANNPDTPNWKKLKGNRRGEDKNKNRLTLTRLTKSRERKSSTGQVSKERKRSITE